MGKNETELSHKTHTENRTRKTNRQILRLASSFARQQAAKDIPVEMLLSLMMFTCEADASETCLFLELSCSRHFEAECVNTETLLCQTFRRN